MPFSRKKWQYLNVSIEQWGYTNMPLFRIRSHTKIALIEKRSHTKMPLVRKSSHTKMPVIEKWAIQKCLK